ncbi:YbaK/EbsC family protein [Nitriliruptoraceae bacterium ZYF776]|nr:YbaK/EbsC family protein [Profundirhabdus halotolerans]
MTDERSATDPPPAAAAADALGLAHEVRATGGARSAAEAATNLGVAPEHLVKTLVVRRAADDHLLVLVPGPSSIAWPKLRSHLGVSRLSLPDADEAREATGYERGTITPLGTRRPLPVIADASLAGAGTISIGSGRHGVALLVDADELLAVTSADVVEVTG